MRSARRATAADLPTGPLPSPTAGCDPIPKSTTCPRFVRIASRCSEGAPNPAEFLDFLPHPHGQERLLSSCRNRINSNPRPRQALHVLVSEVRCFPGTLLALHRLAEMNSSGPPPYVCFEDATLRRGPFAAIAWAAELQTRRTPAPTGISVAQASPPAGAPAAEDSNADCSRSRSPNPEPAFRA